MTLTERLQMFEWCRYECRLYFVGLLFILSIVPLGMDDIFPSSERYKMDWLIEEEARKNDDLVLSLIQLRACSAARDGASISECHLSSLFSGYKQYSMHRHNILSTAKTSI